MLDKKKKVKLAHEDFIKAEHDLIDWRKNKLAKVFANKLDGDIIDEVTGEI